MIQLIFSAFVCSGFFATEFSLSQDVVPPAQLITAGGKTVFTSEWERAVWNRIEDKKSNTAYFIHRKTFAADAAISDKGLILVFTKGYSLTNGPEKPMGLPFTYFSDDVSAQGYSWYQYNKGSVTEVQLNVPTVLEDNFTAKKDGIQFRYFVLSPKFFEEKNLTPQQVKSYSYKKVVELVGTTE